MKRMLMMLACLGGALLTLAPGTIAAESHDDHLAGTAIEVLSSGAPADTGGRMLHLMRITMEPGTVIPAHHHPGPVSLSVAGGSFGTAFVAGTGQVTRATADSGASPITLAPGDDITMEAGDHLFYDGAVHTMRNDGNGELVLLVAALFDPEQPGFLWAEGAPEALAPSAERRMP